MEQENNGCEYCLKVSRKYNQKRTEPTLFTIHIDVEQLKGSLKKNIYKRSKLKEIEKKVSALRNTKGGDVLIHLHNQRVEDRYLGHLDDTIDACLKNLIPDGKLFTDTYHRQWLCDKPGFESYTNIVTLTVEQCEFITTVDYKTKVPSDFMIENPSTVNIVSLLSKSEQLASEPVIRGIDGFEKNLHESRNIELKYFPEEKCENTLSKFVDYIWNNLRFREHLCSMSKLQKGGSFFVGIWEQDQTARKYESKQLVLVSFRRIWDDSAFNACLMNKIQEEASLQTLDGQLISLPENIVKFAFHKISDADDKVVLEIAVGFANGIVFYNKKGPETYTIDKKGDICRMRHEEWLRRMKLLSIQKVC